MIIYLIRSAKRGECPGPRRGPKSRRYSARDATIPEVLADRLSYLCFVLHRTGFFLPRELLRER